MRMRNILEGRWFGHPLHPLLSHLPLGLWLLALIFDIASFSSDQHGWAFQAAAWTLLIGTAVALAVVATGLNDWLDIRQDHHAQNTALFHMAMMMPATGLFIIDTILHFADRNATQVNVIMLCLSIIGYALAMIGGYLGGRLIYDFGIAVGRHRRSTPLPQATIYEPRKGTTEVGLASTHVSNPEFHPVVPESALPEGNTLRVEIHGTILTLARAQGKIFAVQEFCTHRCGPLSEGEVLTHDGTAEIRCPWHRSCFNLASGQVTHGPAKVDLKTFEVQIRDGIIHVRIDQPAPPPLAPPAAADQTLPEARPLERRNPTEPSATRDRPREESPRRTPAE